MEDVVYNDGQREAITTVEGPVLIIAGPGTGKTFTLVERVIYMIDKLNIEPSSIMVSTFTNKAALELLDRLSFKFQERGIKKDVNDMVLGNFHSICRQILDKYLDFSPLKRGYRQIDDVESKYLIYRSLREFRAIPGYDKLIGNRNEVATIEKIVKNVGEYGILERKSHDSYKKSFFDVVNFYEGLLGKANLVDFPRILFYVYKMLVDYPEIRDELRSRINYIMIDEYQDTNDVQEKIIRLLLNDNMNLCVVGDDDQGLYRFRGARVRNIIEFPERYEGTRVIYLDKNYRSNQSIVKFYSDFMQEMEAGQKGRYRYSKKLYSSKQSGDKRVFKLLSRDEEKWHEDLLKTLRDLKDKGVINNFNEIAFLFSSINDVRAMRLASFFKKNGIGIYRPKTSRLLSRQEIRKFIGAIYAIFKKPFEGKFPYVDPDTRDFLKSSYELFYRDCIKNGDLEDFVKRMATYIGGKNFSLNLFDIAYRLFAYEPFFTYLHDEGIAKNISRFLELIYSFSYMNQIHRIDENNLLKFVERFFIDYIAFIKSENIAEFEEDVSLPDKDSISFLTIHASKGMEYPLVFMASVWDKIYKPYKKGLSNLEEIFKDLVQRESFEPEDLFERFDFYRKYYTGFSRAKELLILTSFENAPISKELSGTFNLLDDFNFENLSIKAEEVKEFKLKEIYSYTVDISPYRACPRAFYYFRKLRFTQANKKALAYGLMVHETIEKINEERIRGSVPDTSKLKTFLFENARNKYLQGFIDLTVQDIEEAWQEIKLYLEKLEDFGEPICTEQSIKLSFDDYMLGGNVDYIFKDKEGLHILDFKTGTPPDEEGKHPGLDKYYRQINLYAYLYELSRNEKVDKVDLYFTNLKAKGEILSFEVNEDTLMETMVEISDTVKKIEEDSRTLNFEKTDNVDTCRTCSLRFFCKRL